LKPGTRWRREHTAVACRAILRCGVLNERISILRFDAGIGEDTAKRAALSAYIRSHGPGRMRLRLARALWRAWHDAGRGVV
jgi:hypothetical protein